MTTKSIYIYFSYDRNVSRRYIDFNYECLLSIFFFLYNFIYKKCKKKDNK